MAGILTPEPAARPGRSPCSPPGRTWNYFYGNAQTGLEIRAGGAVVVKDANIYSNAWDGLAIYGNGAVTVTNPSISNNNVGLRIDNDDVTAAVTVGGPNRSGDNVSISSNTAANMVINTKGTLTLSYLTSHGSPMALNEQMTVGDVVLKGSISPPQQRPPFQT